MFNLKQLRKVETIIIQQSEDVLMTFLNHTHATIKNDGSIVTEADLAMQTAIQNKLNEEFGNNIAFLGEECDSPTQQRIAKNEPQFWVLDPLDGTTNFHLSFPVFCTSLALVIDGDIQLGVTYDPIRKECFSALKNQGFYFNQQKVDTTLIKPPNKLEDCIAFVDFKRIQTQQSIQIVSSPAFKSQRNIGSSALEWAWLAMNRAQLSVHGGQKLWDYAAGSLLLSEAGGLSHDLMGKPLYQKNADVRPIIAARSKVLCQLWQTEIDAMDKNH